MKTFGIGPVLCLTATASGLVAHPSQFSNRGTEALRGLRGLARTRAAFQAQFEEGNRAANKPVLLTAAPLNFSHLHGLERTRAAFQAQADAILREIRGPC